MSSERYDAPAILSFFIPGLGQIVKDDIWKGIGLLLGALISLVLMLFIIGFLTYPFVWFYAVYDAYNTPREEGEEESESSDEAVEDEEASDDSSDNGDSEDSDDETDEA